MITELFQEICTIIANTGLMLKTTMVLLLLTINLLAAPEPGQEEISQAAKQHLTDKNYDQALLQYRLLASKNPKSAEPLFQIGWIYNEQKKFDTAVRWLKQAVQLSPQDIRIVSELGFAYSKLNNADDAIAAFKTATQLQADSSSAWLGLGDAYYELKKDYKAAAEAYQKAVALGNNTSSTLYRLGWCLNDAGKHAEAAAMLKRAATQEPQSAPIWLEWGYSLLRSKQFDQAVEALNKANTLDPKQPLGYLYLGRTFLIMKNKAAVIRQIQELKTLDPKKADTLNDELRQADLK